MGLLRQDDWQADWIGYDLDDQPVPAPEFIQRARWIWSETKANERVPPAVRYFRKTFELPADWITKNAVCYFTADDTIQLYLNGSLIRSFRNRNFIYDITLADYLKPGRNSLAFRAAMKGLGHPRPGSWLPYESYRKMVR